MGVKEFITDVQVEMRKVDWPTKARIWYLTGVVLVIVCVATLYTFAVDMVFGHLLVK
jgi:preprotein translocase SecE subunit